jgi:hypothetical protein
LLNSRGKANENWFETHIAQNQQKQQQQQQQQHKRHTRRTAAAIDRRLLKAETARQDCTCPTCFVLIWFCLRGFGFVFDGFVNCTCRRARKVQQAERMALAEGMDDEEEVDKDGGGGNELLIIATLSRNGTKPLSANREGIWPRNSHQCRQARAVPDHNFYKGFGVFCCNFQTYSHSA